jgi:hypothetical protein
VNSVNSDMSFHLLFFMSTRNKFIFKS